MHSLNHIWRRDDFHARVAALATVKDGGRVLDLGCGRGLTVPHLLAKTGMTGEVVAADCSSQSLAAVQETYARQCSDGRLNLIELDIASPLLFASNSFDCVVCQNVIECVADRAGLLAEMARILKPGGTAVVGHYDFDGVLLASDDRLLTRRMIHGYADYTQSWQELSEGQMGRLLPGLFAKSPFSEAVTETVLFTELALSEEGYARDHLNGMVALSSRFGVPEDSARNWLATLQARSDADCFYYALPWTYVVSRAS